MQPGTVLKIAQDRTKINALASSPGERDIPEISAMAWFFRDSLDRETLRDYFLIQVIKVLPPSLRCFLQAVASDNKKVHVSVPCHHGRNPR